MDKYFKPLPISTQETREFWEGCKNHELKVQKCLKCEVTRFPPLPMCPKCNSTDTKWIPVSGKGKVYSWIIVHHPIIDSFREDVPMVIALVDLEGGGRIVTNLIECDPVNIKVNMEVIVEFVDVTEEHTLPKFKPISNLL